MKLDNYGHISYNELLQIEYGALDLLPIQKFLKRDMEAYEVMRAIEDDIEDNIYPELQEYMLKYHELFEDEIFNWMTNDEFITYCKHRFPEVNWIEEYIERHYIG